jgi:hypothetical protein
LYNHVLFMNVIILTLLVDICTLCKMGRALKIRVQMICFQFHEVGELLILHKRTSQISLHVKIKRRNLLNPCYVLMSCKNL